MNGLEYAWKTVRIVWGLVLLYLSQIDNIRCKSLKKSTFDLSERYLFKPRSRLKQTSAIRSVEVELVAINCLGEVRGRQAKFPRFSVAIS